MIYFILATLIVCVTTLVVVSLRLRHDLRIVRGKHSRLQRQIARLLIMSASRAAMKSYYTSRMYGASKHIAIELEVDNIAPEIGKDDELLRKLLDKVRVVPKSLLTAEASAVDWVNYRNDMFENKHRDHHERV